MMSKPVFRQAPWALLLLFSTWCAPGFAAPPPSMPLPECTEEAMQQGFCPRPNPQLEMTATGRFGAGASVTVTAQPVLPVCDSSHDTNGYPWNPSPCWASVSEGTEALCLYYDLQATTPGYKIASCSSVLYLKASSVPAGLFKYFNKDGEEISRCGGAGDYGTYIYGGDASVPAERWVNKGLTYTDCTVAFNGPRPDGLYGPTWMRATTGIGIAQTGDYRGPGHYTSTFVWVPVDGDMRQDFLDVETFLYHESLEQDDDGYTARLKLHVKNNGNKPANNTRVVVSLPSEIHVLRTSDSRCSLEKRAWAGGSFDCTLSLPGNSGTEFIDIDIRIVNNKELEGPVKVEAVIDGDKFPENNITSDTIRIHTATS